MSKQDKIRARQRAQQPLPPLDQVLNRKNLDSQVGRGIVTVATHPRLPLYLYDYTRLCERRGAWDGVTVTTRGLVRDNKGLVVARPFQKFFAWRGRSTSAIRSVSFADEWFAEEKLDGTMVTAANYGGELVLATRRTFDAWQVERARQLWPDGALPEPGTTWVLEYVGPDNLVAVPYATERLVLLSVIDNWTGADRFDLAAALAEHFDRPRRYVVERPEELLEQPHDGLMEGFVCVFPRRDRPSGRLKVKLPEWVVARTAILAGERGPASEDLEDLAEEAAVIS